VYQANELECTNESGCPYEVGCSNQVGCPDEEGIPNDAEILGGPLGSPNLALAGSLESFRRVTKQGDILGSPMIAGDKNRVTQERSLIPDNHWTLVEMP
jgi:hypothetical protein